MTFNFPGYDLIFIQRQANNDKSEHLYTLVYKFYSKITKYNYILRAEYHQGDVFAIKFYCKKDKRSDYKYSKITNKGDVGNIFITCAKVVPLLLNDYPNASFGFSGARSIDSKSKKVENYNNNQRFRLYKYVVALKFGTRTFAHYEYEKISAYLLVNKRVNNILQKEKELVRMFAATYETLPDI